MQLHNLFCQNLVQLTNREFFLKNKNIVDTLVKKNKERIKFYRQADSHIVNENSDIEMTVEALVEELLLKKVVHK